MRTALYEGKLVEVLQIVQRRNEMDVEMWNWLQDHDPRDIEDGGAPFPRGSIFSLAKDYAQIVELDEGHHRSDPWWVPLSELTRT
jgi:hypothetical protein